MKLFTLSLFLLIPSFGFYVKSLIELAFRYVSIVQRAIKSDGYNLEYSVLLLDTKWILIKS